ncbi:hypothetical protein E5345_01245 [Propionibacterium sp. NM47_B9-13]|nr:hypothetical protein HMPREF9621_01827 [Cutibacterium modestum HL037PA2]EFT14655.1 hypothetical protein HMPREF9622_02336 [Cutibacterium modestum HL037PA3]REB73542.1 hypothetical protein CP877_08125 [Cutibacterium modestum]TGY29944.1 hypothetical protein E5345_01245 [Propionibacterium sp. NM47_B9-13]
MWRTCADGKVTSPLSDPRARVCRASQTAEHHRSPVVEDPANTVNLSAITRCRPTSVGPAADSPW